MLSPSGTLDLFNIWKNSNTSRIHERYGLPLLRLSLVVHNLLKQSKNFHNFNCVTPSEYSNTIILSTRLLISGGHMHDSSGGVTAKHSIMDKRGEV
jgi:hypothetical protein